MAAGRVSRRFPPALDSRTMSAAPAAPPSFAPPPVRRRPGRLYLNRADYERFLETAERPHEWKCGIGLSENGEELGEVLPVDGYDEDGNPAMPTYAHACVLDDLLDRLAPAMSGSGFERLSQGMAVRGGATGRQRFPDVLILKSPATFEPHPEGKQLVLTNPAVLIEVLSDSTETEDLTTKLGDYASIPSVTDYLILAQDERLALHYARPAGSAPADGWHVTRHAGADAAVTIAEPAVEINLGELYARVFPPA